MEPTREMAEKVTVTPFLYYRLLLRAYHWFWCLSNSHLEASGKPTYSSEMQTNPLTFATGDNGKGWDTVIFRPRVGGSTFFSVTFIWLFALSVFLIGSMYSADLPDSCPPDPELWVERLCLAGSCHKGMLLALSWGSLLIATVLDTKDIMGNLLGRRY